MSKSINCPIWNVAYAEELASTGDYIHVKSWRVDGEYRLSGTIQNRIGGLNNEQRAKLTTWIVDQHRSGEVAPLVTDRILVEVLERKRLAVSERKRRFFRLALARNFQPSGIFKIAGENDDTFRTDTGSVAAWMESSSDSERNGIVGLLQQEGLVDTDRMGFLTITSSGFDLMETLATGGAPTRQAFIAMWFDPSMDEAAKAIESAVAEAGYKPMRIDRKEHSNKIDDEIIAEIRRSRFLIADFTCGITESDGKKAGIARGGVYFEAGFALGLRMDVIWTCRRDCIDLVHFDTRQYSHIDWETPDDLRKRLETRIRAIIS